MEPPRYLGNRDGVTGSSFGGADGFGRTDRWVRGVVGADAVESDADDRVVFLVTKDEI